MRQEELLAYIDNQEEAKLRVCCRVHLSNTIKNLMAFFFKFLTFLFASFCCMLTEEEILLVIFAAAADSERLWRRVFFSHGASMVC